MGPMAKLSQVERVNIVARISKSGQASVSPGDIEGRYNGVEVFSDASVTVVIRDQL